jgi:RNA polymerase sigma-70 factor (ECF subfamily)
LSERKNQRGRVDSGDASVSSGYGGEAPLEPGAETTLIDRVLGGEKELFYQLIRPYERRVYATAFGILQDAAEAEDVAQETMLKAFIHLKQFRGEARFSTWLTRVAINEARMRIRKRHLEIMKPMEPAAPDDGEEVVPKDYTDWREIPSEELERKEVREYLFRALSALDQKYREVFVLRDMEQLSILETAEVVGISPGAVKTRLLRARLMLREALSPGMASGFGGGVRFDKGRNPWV